MSGMKGARLAISFRNSWQASRLPLLVHDFTCKWYSDIPTESVFCPHFPLPFL